MEQLPMVRCMARRIHARLPRQVQLDEMVSAGMVGLMEAVHKFDSGKHTKFGTFAQYRVRGAILDSLRTLDWGSRDTRRKGRAVEEAVRALTVRLRRAPDETEIAVQMGMTIERYRDLTRNLDMLELGTLNAPRHDYPDEEEIAYVPGRVTDDPLYCCLHSEVRGRVLKALHHLTEQERSVLILYYDQEMTMSEIAQVLSVVETRISQIHSAARAKLKDLLEDLRDRWRFTDHMPIGYAA